MKIQILLLLMTAIVAVVPVSVSAMSGGDYEVNRNAIDSGGGTSSGGAYIVRGTIGQHNAAYSQGGNYELLGGFWPGEPICFVEFEDFAVFAQQWLYIGGGLDADFSGDNDVDSEDLGLFSDEWLYWCPYNWPLK